MARRKKVGGSNLLFSDVTRKAFGRALKSSSLQAGLLKHQLVQMADTNDSVGGMIFTPAEARVLEKGIQRLDEVQRICNVVGERAKDHARLEL